VTHDAVGYLGLGVIVQNSTVVFNTIKWVGVILFCAGGILAVSKK
jgi:threonine/homoserine/homoserine lactone efflux protein